MRSYERQSSIGRTGYPRAGRGVVPGYPEAPMEGSAGVMALVLGESVAGAAALLWLTPLWREVKRGYFTLSGLLLGHWYLTDRGLTRGPIQRATTFMVVAIGLEVLAVATSGFGGVGASPDINPLLTAGALAPWIALGMVATTGLIAGMVKLVLRGERASAVQSATGFFYLAVVTAFTAEVAVKTRFLPS